MDGGFDEQAKKGMPESVLVLREPRFPNEGYYMYYF